MKNTFINALLVGSFALTLGCGSKDRDKSSNQAGNDLLSLSMPQANEKDVIEIQDLPRGTYLVSSIQTLVITKSDRAGFLQKMKVLGQPKTGDKIIRAEKFSNATKKSSKTTALTAELNLALRVDSDSRDVEMLQLRYYWTQVFSKNKGWQWKINLPGQVGGAAIAESFMKPQVVKEKRNQLHVANYKIVSAAVLKKDKLELYSEIKLNGGGTVRARVTYIRKALNAKTVSAQERNSKLQVPHTEAEPPRTIEDEVGPNVIIPNKEPKPEITIEVPVDTKSPKTDEEWETQLRDIEDELRKMGVVATRTMSTTGVKMAWDIWHYQAWVEKSWNKFDQELIHGALVEYNSILIAAIKALSPANAYRLTHPEDLDGVLKREILEARQLLVELTVKQLAEGQLVDPGLNFSNYVLFGPDPKLWPAR